MPEKRDYYEILGVSRSASEAEIKSAYRRLAMQHHPDRNPGSSAAEESFKEAAEAYAVLSDSGKRGQYDRFGHAAVGGGNGSSGFDPSQFADFSDIFGDFFGFGDLFGSGRGGRGRAQRGSDLRYDLEITFEQSLTGAEPEIAFQRLTNCESCGGKQTRGGGPPAPCATCGGRGQVRFQQGFFSVARTCAACAGAGVVIRDPCPACRGQGRLQRPVRKKVTIPAGIEDGMQLRLTGEGESGPMGGPAGDLYVLVRVRPHPQFERKGNDLFCHLPISFPQAALGCEISVPTPWGEHMLTIPAGTAAGAELRPLKGLGVPRINGRGRGDFHVIVSIDVPRKLTREQRAALQALDAVLPGASPTRDPGLVDKMKGIFS